ncbi:MAG: acetolactate synthase small subunit [Clostridiales bacterium]|nr:acetolactate synthase small subunit [Clostridiales bacterium]
MKKRWISLYVENDVGTLAKIAGLFAAKLYNLESLSVGPTADESVSRITIGLTGDDRTFEQVKKQLNRCIEIITVLDFTDRPVYSKELMYVRLSGCNASQMAYLERLAQQAKLNVAERTGDSILLECLMDEACNSALVASLRRMDGKLEVARGGSVAIASGAG